MHGYEQGKEIKKIQPLRVNNTGTVTRGEVKKDSRPEKKLMLDKEEEESQTEKN